MHRRWLAALVAGAVAVAVSGCSSAGDASGPATSEATGTAPATSGVEVTAQGSSTVVDPPGSTATTPTTVAATTVAPTTLAPTTVATTASASTLPVPTVAPPTTAPAPVTPVAVCLDRTNGESWFAYENAGAAPVGIVLGSGNRIEGADPGQGNPLPPTVFAPGRVSPAVVVFGTATWTLRGPDGVVRTANAADAPDCTDELRAPSIVDERAPVVSLSWSMPPDPAATPDQVVLTASVDGLPDGSVCAAGLDPQPPLVWFDPTRATPLTVGRTMSVPVTLGVVPDPATGAAGQALGFVLRAWYVDRCAGAGTVNRAWPSGLAGTFGLSAVVCVRLRDGQALGCEANDPANPFDRGLWAGMRARSAAIPLG